MRGFHLRRQVRLTGREAGAWAFSCLEAPTTVGRVSLRCEERVAAEHLQCCAPVPGRVSRHPMCQQVPGSASKGRLKAKSEQQRWLRREGRKPFFSKPLLGLLSSVVVSFMLGQSSLSFWAQVKGFTDPSWGCDDVALLLGGTGFLVTALGAVVVDAVSLVSSFCSSVLTFFPR